MRWIAVTMLVIVEVAAATSGIDSAEYSCLPAQRAANSAAASLYWQAKQLLNREEYRRAAQLFGQAAEYDTLSESGAAPDALYWQAFALYRLGTEQDLQQARALLEQQRSLIDEQKERVKAALAQQRKRVLASLIPQRRQLQDTLAKESKRYQEALEAQLEENKRYQSELERQHQQTLARLEEQRQQSLAALEERSKQLLATFDAQSKQNQAAFEAQRKRNKRSWSKEAFKALEQQQRESQAALQEQRWQSLAALEEQGKESAAAFEMQRQQSQAAFEAQQKQQQQSLAALDAQRRQSLAALAAQNKQSLVTLEKQRTQRLAALDEQARQCSNAFDVQQRQSQSLHQRVAGELARRGDAVAARSVREGARGHLNCDRNHVAVRIEALTALSKLDPDALRPILEDTLERHEACFKPLRKRAIFLLGQQEEAPEAARLLVQVVRTDPDADLRREAVLLLKDKGSIHELTRLYEVVEDLPTKASLIALFAQRTERAAIDKLIGIARQEPDRKLRLQAIAALSNSSDPRVRWVLKDIVQR